MKRGGMVVALVAVAALVSAAALSGRRAAPDAFAVGTVAPDFSAEDQDGVAFKLSDYRGKVVVLDFWGFWCPSCVATLPDAKKLTARMKDKPFAFVAVNTDGPREALKPRLVQEGVTWRNAVDGSTVGPITKAWGVTLFPTIYVIDEAGVIRASGYLRGEALDTLVEDLVAKVKSGRPEGAPR